MEKINKYKFKINKIFYFLLKKDLIKIDLIFHKINRWILLKNYRQENCSSYLEIDVMMIFYFQK